MITALTVAGSDSGGGAGIQADLKTFAAHDVYGTCAITAVTAQNTIGVQAVEILSPAIVGAQIDSVFADIGADAVKTGMLGNAAIIEVVATAMRRHAVERLVVDPVMIAKSGNRLLADDAIDALRQQLLPMTYVLTPNLPEASALLACGSIERTAMRDAARELLRLGPRYVVLKGGHLPGNEVVDVLVGAEITMELRAERIATPNTHGTGCTYSAAIAALLGQGNDIAMAVTEAHHYLQGAIASAVSLGHGHGPVNHLYRGLPSVRA